MDAIKVSIPSITFGIDQCIKVINDFFDSLFYFVRVNMMTMAIATMVNYFLFLSIYIRMFYFFFLKQFHFFLYCFLSLLTCCSDFSSYCFTLSSYGCNLSVLSLINCSFATCSSINNCLFSCILGISKLLLKAFSEFCDSISNFSFELSCCLKAIVFVFSDLSLQCSKDFIDLCINASVWESITTFIIVCMSSMMIISFLS